MSEEKPVVVGVDYGTESCREVAVEIYRGKVRELGEYAEGEEAALAAAGRCLKFEDMQTFRMEPKAIPGQEIHRPSRNRGQTPTFIPFDDSYISGESSHQTSESSDIGAGLSWMDSSRGRIGNTLEFIPGDEPNVNSEYGYSLLSPLRDDRRWFDETKPFTHDEKAALFYLNHKPGRVAGLRLLADALVAAPVQKVSNEIKASFTLAAPDLELDADGNPTTLESAMALDAVDALCAAEDERWKKEIEEMEFDFSKESIVEMLNEELVAEGRDPFYSVQMLSAQASAALRKKQKARKKKRK